MCSFKDLMFYVTLLANQALRWILSMTNISESKLAFWQLLPRDAFQLASGKFAKKKVGLTDLLFNKFGTPKGIRTPVTAVKRRCPRPD